MPPYLDRLLSRVHHYHLFIEAGAGDAGAGGSGGSAGTPPVVPTPAPSLAPDPAPAVALGGGDPPADPPIAPGAFPDNWREMLAGDDAKELARLKRLAAPADMHKAWRSLEKKMSSGQPVAALPDDATPEEIAAYRKTAGIPDKPESYGLAFPEEWKPTDADKEGLAAFAEYALAKNMTPAAAKTAFDFYAAQTAAAQTARAEAALVANQEAIAELRGEYRGSEFKRNMTIAEDFLAKHFDGSEQGLDRVLNATLENGVKIKNDPEFVKGLVRMARAYADEEALVGGDGAGGGKSIEAEIAELNKKAATTRLSKAEDERLDQLYAARIRAEERAGRRAA